MCFAMTEDVFTHLVDCTVHRELCEKYKVRGFPTLKLFRDDGSEPTDYDAARKSDAIVKFMVK